jgi:hypothetical protein
MPGFRTWAILCGGSFALLLIIGWGGSILQSMGAIHDPGAMKIPFVVLMIGLLAIFAVSAIPVMVFAVLGFQRTIGNDSVPAVRTAITHANLIVYILWGLIGAGTLVAIPGAYLSGAFGDKPLQSLNASPTPGSRGTLVARPGMTFTEMARQSTLRIDINTRAPVTSAVGAGGVFDFHVPGTGLFFKNCRYYFVSPYTHSLDRIETVNVGLSPRPVSRNDVETANSELRARLAADGWLTGHEEYRTETDRVLHSGATRGPEGSVWTKNGLVLDISTRRMDDPTPGENEKTAGKWIQFIDLWEKADYPSIERYVFPPPRTN